MSAPSVVQQVATYGLPSHVSAFPPEPLPESDWEALLWCVEGLRLAGFLRAAVDDGALPATADQAEVARQLHLRWCGQVLRLEQRLLAVAAELDAAGIDFVVLKGSAVAHLAYPDAGLRLFGDVDLLFRSGQFDRALAVLGDLGYRRAAAEARPGFDRRFGKGATLKGVAGDELDTHRNLVLGTFGFAIDLEELFRSTVPFTLGGRELRALGPEARLLHACYHAALGDPRPRFGSVRDIAQMLATGSHDPYRVVELARAWESQAVLARGVALCRAHLGVVVAGPVVDAVEGYEPSSRERRAIASYVGPNRRFATKVVASLPYLEGVRERGAFLRAVARPDPAFVTANGGQPGWPWVRRGLRSMVRGGLR